MSNFLALIDNKIAIFSFCFNIFYFIKHIKGFCELPETRWKRFLNELKVFKASVNLSTLKEKGERRAWMEGVGRENRHINTKHLPP